MSDTYPHCNATRRTGPRPATCHEPKGHDGDHRWLPDAILSQMFRREDETDEAT